MSVCGLVVFVVGGVWLGLLCGCVSSVLVDRSVGR